jgi:hypothetical protein
MPHVAREGNEKERPVQTKEEQVRADLALHEVDRLQRFDLSASLLQEYGRFIGALAPWTHFVTLTHDPRRLGAGHTMVGRQRHRKQLGAWLRDDVRAVAPGFRWWSEMEEHESGQAHEHGLLEVRSTAPLLSIRQRWYERCGYVFIRPVESVQAAAEYVAKYTGKAASSEPVIRGFGLLSRPSFSRSFAELVR